MIRNKGYCTIQKLCSLSYTHPTQFTTNNLSLRAVTFIPGTGIPQIEHSAAPSRPQLGVPTQTPLIFLLTQLTCAPLHFLHIITCRPVIVINSYAGRSEGFC